MTSCESLWMAHSLGVQIVVAGGDGPYQPLEGSWGPAGCLPRMGRGQGEQCQAQGPLWLMSWEFRTGHRHLLHRGQVQEVMGAWHFTRAGNGENGKR